MVTIRYYFIDKTTGQQHEGDVLHDGIMQALPLWLQRVRDPDHTNPLELWSPIQGDPNHMVHITGLVSYWYCDRDFVASIMDEIPKDRGIRFQELAPQYPEHQYTWAVQAETRNHERVCKSDQRYQQQLAATFDEPHHN
jgi:hypothetical protein